MRKRSQTMVGKPEGPTIAIINADGHSIPHMESIPSPIPESDQYSDLESTGQDEDSNYGDDRSGDESIGRFHLEREDASDSEPERITPIRHDSDNDDFSDVEDVTDMKPTQSHDASHTYEFSDSDSEDDEKKMKVTRERPMSGGKNHHNMSNSDEDEDERPRTVAARKLSLTSPMRNSLSKSSFPAPELAKISENSEQVKTSRTGIQDEDEKPRGLARKVSLSSTARNSLSKSTEIRNEDETSRPLARKISLSSTARNSLSKSSITTEIQNEDEASRPLARKISLSSTTRNSLSKSSIITEIQNEDEMSRPLARKISLSSTTRNSLSKSSSNTPEVKNVGENSEQAKTSPHSGVRQRAAAFEPPQTSRVQEMLLKMREQNAAMEKRVAATGISKSNDRNSVDSIASKTSSHRMSLKDDKKQEIADITLETEVTVTKEVQATPTKLKEEVEEEEKAVVAEIPVVQYEALPPKVDNEVVVDTEVENKSPRVSFKNDEKKVVMTEEEDIITKVEETHNETEEHNNFEHDENIKNEIGVDEMDYTKKDYTSNMPNIPNANVSEDIVHSGDETQHEIHREFQQETDERIHQEIEEPITSPTREFHYENEYRNSVELEFNEVPARFPTRQHIPPPPRAFNFAAAIAPSTTDTKKSTEESIDGTVEATHDEPVEEFFEETSYEKVVHETPEADSDDEKPTLSSARSSRTNSSNNMFESSGNRTSSTTVTSSDTTPTSEKGFSTALESALRSASPTENFEEEQFDADVLPSSPTTQSGRSEQFDTRASVVSELNDIPLDSDADYAAESPLQITPATPVASTFTKTLRESITAIATSAMQTARNRSFNTSSSSTRSSGVWSGTDSRPSSPTTSSPTSEIQRPSDVRRSRSIKTSSESQRSTTKAPGSKKPIRKPSEIYAQNHPRNRDTMSSIASTEPAFDLLLARLEAQNQELRKDPKNKRHSLKLQSELKDSFDRVYQEHKQQVEQLAEEDNNEEDINWEYWGTVVNDFHKAAKQNPKLLTKNIQVGIPPALRGTIWQLFSQSKDTQLEATYAELLSQESVYEKMIQRDLNRTFPGHEYFKEENGVGQEALYNVVRAYSIYDDEVGYCQGLGFVVGPLLLNMPDEEAFCVLVKLMKTYGLRGHFTPQMEVLHLRLYQFDGLVQEHIPRIDRALHTQGIRSTMYASQWFMTLFAYSFPLNLVFRIYDIIFAEGVEAIFRFAIALLKRNENTILGLEFEELLDFLKNGLFDVYKDNEKTFVEDAYAIKITSKRLEKLSQQYTLDMTKAAQENEALEGLRKVNNQLSEQIKRLEASLATMSKDHTELANNLINTKMENARINDENEALRMQVSELKKHVDQIPAQVAEQFRAETETLGVKNVELVQHNTQLEDQCAYLEGEVITMKMRYAEAENQREELARKLQTMKKALGV